MKKIVFLISMLLLAACGESSKQFIVDNPTTNDIVVELNGKAHEIPANSSTRVTLPAGRNKMVFNGEAIDFMVNPKDQDVIMNPTLTPYVLYSMVYRDESAGKEVIAKALESSLVEYTLANGEKIELPWRYTQGELFFDKYDYYWHFGLSTGFPEVYRVESSYTIDNLTRVKIFRLPDFEKFVLDQYGQTLLPELIPEKDSRTLKELALPSLETVIGTPICPNVAEDLKIKIKEYRNMLENKDASKHRRLKDQLTMFYYSEFQDLFSKETYEVCKALEGEKYSEDENGLRKTYGRVMALFNSFGPAFVIE